MPGNVASLAVRFRVRYDEKCRRHGLDYPWWIALTSGAAQVGAAVVGVEQRDALVPPGWLALAVVLVALPYVVQWVIHPWVPWRVTALLVTAGVALLLTVPVVDAEPVDFAPAVLGILAAEVTATDGLKAGLASAAASIGLLLMPWNDAATGELLALYVGEVLFGLVIGYMLFWQMRALRAERAARADERARATLAERQRIAREIHDLVAHSLSVTMLHVTGARRALSEDADVSEAIDALVDAERIGRQAMADIRRTVSVLATESAGATPLPGALDIDDLVAEARAAGLDVTYTAEGEVAVLPPAAGLGLFRVVQESLANVVRHAPGAPARVRLEVGRSRARLHVSNPLPVTVAAARDGGSGLTNMASRAEQLGGSVTAGPDGREWVVDFVLPVESGDEPHCVVRRAMS